MPAGTPQGPSDDVEPDDLLEDVLERVHRARDEQQRWRLLLDAVVSMAADLSLDELLSRVVQIAADLAGARYAALGVLGNDRRQRLRTFITHGMSEEQIGQIGPYPEGYGILGLIIDHPEPLRLRELAAHPASYGFPPHHPPMTSFLGVPVLARGKVFGNLYLTDKIDAEEFDASDERIVVALAAAAGVAIENATLHEEAERRERWLAATAEVIANLVGGASGADALQLVADRARALAEADVAWIVVGSDPGLLRLSVVAGVPAEAAAVEGVVAEDSLEATVVRTGRPLTVEDLAGGDPGATSQSGTQTSSLRWPDLGPAILVPLTGERGADGVVALAWTPPRRDVFYQLDPALPTNFAEQAALALRIARSASDKQRLGLYEERERIARDLHDVVIQRLFAIGLSLQGTLRAKDTTRMSQAIDRAVDDLDETIRDIRRTIFELGSPDQADDAQSEVTRVCDRAASSLKFRPRVSFEGPVRTCVEPSLVPQLVAVLSELLSNAARHAAASSVSVVLSALGDHITLRVTDDGKGLPQEREESGLANLRQRAAALGGSFTVNSGKGAGTVVEWRVPAQAGRAAVPAPRRGAPPSDVATEASDQGPGTAPAAGESR